jgi:DNA-binding response OmpR family regulator
MGTMKGMECKKTVVLLIEDNAEIRKLLEILVRRLGGEPISAASVREAALLIMTTPMRLAFVDYLLPDGIGLALASEIKARNPGARVVLLSARDESVLRDDVAKAGFDSYVAKPFTLEAIAREFALSVSAAGALA